MAAVVSSYPPNMYHQHRRPLLTPFYGVQFLPRNYPKLKPQKPPKPQKPQKLQQKRARTPAPKPEVERVDRKMEPWRPRRQPRIHRQVILLPTPEPIYRQVRRRLPTPERQVIRRTFLQRANGDVIVQQERHRKKPRSKTPTYPVVSV